MDKHWRHYCTLSLVHFMAFPQTAGGEGPLVETVAQVAADPFFGGLEIGWIKDPQVRAEVRAILEASHLQVAYGAQSSILIQKLNLNSLDPAERRRAVEGLKWNVDGAAEMGAKRLAFLSGKDPGDADRPAAVDALVASTREVSAYARDRGVALVCELFDRAVDKKCLIGPSPEAVEYAARVRQDFPEFGLMYDLSHMPLMFEQPEPALTLLREHLVHAHVGNCVLDPSVPGYGDLHPPFGWPGSHNGVPELAEFVRALFKVGYLGGAPSEAGLPWVGFEVKPQSAGQRSEHVIAGAQRAWEQAWALV